jgi:uncharacterized protein YgbK (DUF1537 family)
VTAHALPSGLVLTYYGDDFSGSTDVTEALTFNGLPAVLFLEDPSQERLDRFRGFRALGIAGVSRSQTPEWMAANLPPIFERLKSLGAPLCHYKTCSTFDSSPQIGSIGKAIDLGQSVFGSSAVPLVVGAPILKRYQVFGNLFAAVDGEAFRLDRHPTMSRHPVTPMDEADLRIHLSRQTSKRTALVDILALRSSDIDERFDALMAENPEIVLYDVLDTASLIQAGRLIWTRRPNAPGFVAGSSGLEYALVAYWQSTGQLPEPEPHAQPGEVDRLLVVSGSCSPTTERQLRFAMDKGYEGLRLDARKLAQGDGPETQRAVEAALKILTQGRSVALYSALGPEDPALSPAAGDFQRGLGLRIGVILRDVLQRSGIRRAVVAGGDTSGQAGRQLGVYALTVLKPMAPGSPLCRAWADGPFDGLEIVFKGGQVGDVDFFEKVRCG